MKKVNLGCGTDYKEGWVNVDISDIDIYGRKIKVDAIHDLNKYPWPFKSAEFSEILMKGTLEHIKDLERGVNEIRRIASRNARVIINVPYFMSYFAYRELNTHKFSLNAFQLFNIFRKNDMLLVSKNFRNNNRFFKWVEKIVNLNSSTQNFYERLLTGFFQMNQIEWVFRVKYI